ncbi:YesL family protein [Jeotgalibacillus proteolyticus]|uniref:DUF624 domain-containing protein n=1 Tax=Jeotgalibacillus proteolyticus TaxID=2082395 RepID=A0A2S5GBK0_9BACL|nr:YesL family protein [Jeotgalibacillus proteolyticus]PPA70402.1 hypothetical protein C4B60_12570 [Jeotgalibacillus proteolyticus]
MVGSQNPVFRTMEVLTAFFLLNFVWLISCLPLITILPATKAMFAVLTEWKEKGISTGVFIPFYKKIKHDFFKNFFLGIIWMGVGTVLYLDILVLMQMNFPGSGFVLLLTVFLSLAFLFTSIYLPMMKGQCAVSMVASAKNSFLFSIANLLHTLWLLLILIFSIFIIYLFPFMLFINISLTAFYFNHVFTRLTNRSRPDMKLTLLPEGQTQK